MFHSSHEVAQAQESEKVVFDNGDSYVGEMQDGKPHGYGAYTWTDGAMFAGQWSNGLKNGQGTYLYPNGDCYTGEYCNGHKHGVGIATWTNGTKYEGQWGNGKEHGQGTFWAPDGRKYIGSFKNGVPDGVGTHSWPDGYTFSSVHSGGLVTCKGTVLCVPTQNKVGEPLPSSPNAHEAAATAAAPAAAAVAAALAEKAKSIATTTRKSVAGGDEAPTQSTTILARSSSSPYTSGANPKTPVVHPTRPAVLSAAHHKGITTSSGTANATDWSKQGESRVFQGSNAFENEGKRVRGGAEASIEPSEDKGKHSDNEALAELQSVRAALKKRPAQ